jgi:hypothetical protein
MHKQQPFGFEMFVVPALAVRLYKILKGIERYNLKIVTAPESQTVEF